MAALRWTAVAAVSGVLAGHAGPAAAQEPVPTPTATPVPTPTATPTATPTPLPVPVPPPPAVAGTVIYIITVTTTTTTTAINAPITWVAAPITTNVSNTSATNDTTANNVNGSNPGTQASNGAGGGAGAGAAPGQTELNLRGCGRRARARSARGKAVIQTARIRIPSDAQLAVRVNGKSVGNLRLDPGARQTRGIPLRVELAANGVLTVYRPSGRILRVQACTPK
jgi:hypothetical protein